MNRVPIYSVYRLVSPTGKQYIGATHRKPDARWNHGRNYRSNSSLYADIEHFGWEAFRKEVIAENLSADDAYAMEIRLICEADSTNPDCGYNRSTGGPFGTSGYHFSPDSKRRMGDSRRGQRRGVPLTAAHKRHLSESLRGHAVTEKTRSKLREVLGDRFNTPEARAKQKMNTPKGVKHHRAMAVLCVETGAVYGTIADATKAHGKDRNAIARCLRGQQQTAFGYHWKQYLSKEKS